VDSLQRSAITRSILLCLDNPPVSLLPYVYVQVDNCGSSAMGDARFLAFADAVNRTGRLMVISSEPFNILPSPSHARFSHLWRTQADIGPEWDQVLSTMDMNEQWWPVSGPHSRAHLAARTHKHTRARRGRWLTT
jgi:hypothetical protein